MSDNLSVAVTADISALQTQLAIAQADVRAYAAEVRTAANELRGAGDDIKGGLLSQLEAAAGSLAGARGEVGKLTAELGIGRRAHEEHTSAIHATNEALSGMVSPITGAVGGLREMAEIIGVAFAAERGVEFIKGMAELGEKTINTAAAVGMSAGEFSLLSRAMELVGGDSDLAARSLIILQTKLVEAVENPASKAREAFLAMGISLEEMRSGVDKVANIFPLLSRAWNEFDASSSKTAAFRDVLGRGGKELIPVIREYEELVAEAKKTGAAFTDEQAERFAALGKQIHDLSISFEGLGKSIIDGWINPITTATTRATEFVQELIRLRGVAGPTANDDTAARMRGKYGDRGDLVGGDMVTLADKGPRVTVGREGTSLKEDINDFFQGVENFFGGPGRQRDLVGSGVGFGTRQQREGVGPSLPFPTRGNEIRNAAETPLPFVDEHGNHFSATVSGGVVHETGRIGEAGEHGGEGGAKPIMPNVVVDAVEQKNLAADVKAVADALKLEEAQLNLAIQAAKGDEATIQELSQKKIDAARRAAQQEQGIREQYAAKADARGNTDLAQQYRTGGTSLQVQDLTFQKEKLPLQQKYDEQTASSEIKRLETDRRIDAQEQTTELQAVERRRQLGDITADQAAAREIRIVDNHLAAAERIFADEMTKADGIKKLADDEIEAVAKAEEEKKRIRDKAAQEAEQRAHPIDKELGGSLASGVVGVAWGKETPGQALGSFAQQQETKAASAVFTKLLDASGIGKLVDTLSNKVLGIIPGAAENAPIVAAITGQTGAITGAITAQTAALLGGDAAQTGAQTATTVSTEVANTAATEATDIADTAAIVTAVGAAATEESIAANIPKPLGFAGGGIVPSAAGGMVVNDGKGGMLSILHPQEMVLPSSLSLGIQDAIRRPGGWTITPPPASFALSPNFAAGGGPAGAGGSVVINNNVSAIDARSVEQFFKTNSHLVARAMAGARGNLNPNAF